MEPMAIFAVVVQFFATELLCEAGMWGIKQVTQTKVPVSKWRARPLFYSPWFLWLNGTGELNIYNITLLLCAFIVFTFLVYKILRFIYKTIKI